MGQMGPDMGMGMGMDPYGQGMDPYGQGMDPYAMGMSMDPYGMSMDPYGNEYGSAPSSYVEAQFGENDRPIGLALSWSYALPMVEEVLINSPAEFQPQIQPGLVLVAINGYSIPPGTSRPEVEDQMQYRPIVLGFDVPTQEDLMPAGVEVFGGLSGNLLVHAYQLGECYRSKSALIMRFAEDLESKIVAKAGKGSVMQALEYGKDEG